MLFDQLIIDSVICQ